MMYELIKGTSEGQDGNKGYSEKIIGVFRFLEEAIDCYYNRPQNGRIRYYARNLNTRRIIDLPIKAEPKEKSRWIPARERLPENEDWVIVTILDERGDMPFRYTDFGWYFDRAECWIVDAEQRNDVVAWMPLPEPYKRK